MSSSRNFLNPYSIISSGNMSSNITSPATNIKFADQVGIQITSTNTSAVGQWSIEGSLDNTNFIPLTFSPAVAPTLSGANDSILIDMKLISFVFIRVKWTGSGVGTANVLLTTKGA